MSADRYEPGSTFKPCYSAGRPIFITHDDHVVCAHDGSNGMEINVLDRKTLTNVATLTEVKGVVTVFAVCPSNDTIVLATKSLLLQKMDLKEQKILKTWKSYHTQPVMCLTLNHLGTRLVSGGADHQVRIWHIGAGEGTTRSCRFHNSLITLLVFHPTQSQLFSAASLDYRVAVWDAESGDHLGTLEGHQDRVTGLVVHQDFLATCGRDKVILIWNPETFAKISTIPTYESMEACLLVTTGPLSTSPHLITGGQSGALKVWNVATRTCALHLATRTGGGGGVDGGYSTHSVLTLRRCHGDVLLVGRQSDSLEFYEEASMSLQAEWTGDLGEVRELSVCGANGDMLLLAEASPNLKLFPRSTTDGAWWCRLAGGGHTAEICALGVAPVSGTLVATGDKEGVVCVWLLVGVECRLVAKGCSHNNRVTAVTFDREQSLLLTCDSNASLRIWQVTDDVTTIDHTTNTNTGSGEPHKLCLLESQGNLHDDVVNDVTVAINNSLVATASKDRTVKIWKLEKKLSLQGVLRGHKKGVWSVRFSSVEKCVLTASGDGDVKIWNIDDFSCIKTLEGHDCPVYKAVYISKCQQVLSCDQRGLVRLWTVSSSDAVQTLTAHEGRVWTLAVTPDEAAFFTGGEDGVIAQFKDVTQSVLLEKKEKLEKFIQSEQELSNLIKEERYSKALQLSIKLEQPGRTLSIIKGIQASTPEKLEPALADLTPESIATLLTYATQWNTSARNSWSAQCVLQHVFSRFHPNELVKWPGVQTKVEALIAYSERHYRRLNGIEERLGLLDYMCSAIQHNRTLQENVTMDQK